MKKYLLLISTGLSLTSGLVLSSACNNTQEKKTEIKKPSEQKDTQITKSEDSKKTSEDKGKDQKEDKKDDLGKKDNTDNKSDEKEDKKDEADKKPEAKPEDVKQDQNNLKSQILEQQTQLLTFAQSLKNEAQYKYESLIDTAYEFIHNFGSIESMSKDPKSQDLLKKYSSELQNVYKTLSEQKETLKSQPDIKPSWAGENYDKNNPQNTNTPANSNNVPELDAINAVSKKQNGSVNEANAAINQEAIDFISYGGDSFIESLEDFTYTQEQKANVRNFLETKVLKAGMSLKNKIDAIFDWIATNVKYANANNFPRINPWEIIQHKYAVCGGYSSLYKEWLDMIGVKSVMVIGWSSAGDHQWNLIKDPETNQWYHSDATWGSVSRKYERMDSRQISNDHKAIRVLNYTYNFENNQYEYWKGVALKNSSAQNVIVPDTLGTFKVQNIANTILNSQSIKSIQLGGNINNLEYEGTKGSLEAITASETNPNYSTFDALLYSKDFSRILYTPSAYKQNKITLHQRASQMYDAKDLFNLASLKFIDVEPGNYSFASYKGNLYNNDYSQLLAIAQANSILQIHANTKLQGQEVSFKDNLRIIKLDEGISIIPAEVFKYLPNLQKVYLPNSLTSIDPNAFVSVSPRTSLITKSFNQLVSEFAKRNNFEYIVE
ncbi:transglutaminase domain-containing protein [Mycoplasma simbae]|uniref:transglutaminase domain-containing protein n=1 Tax=Mycoplasma simbae TaxID=36744 RepID=UPI000494E44E|nr:transglutaminase domain-containing protein [Mycoplasma simbae]